MFGFSKLDVMFGHASWDGVRLRYTDIDRSNVVFRREHVTGIDPVRKRVETNANTYETDVLVIALGADLAPEQTPGLLDGGHEFYSPEGAARLAGVLPAFVGGDVVIAVLGGLFKCPPAPYEAAFMLHDFLRRRGLREASSIHVVTPMPKPIPVSDEVSDAIVGLLDDRGIGHAHATRISRYDAAARLLHLADGATMPCDLLLGVPVHVAPPVVVESGLTEDGWVPVDPVTLATRFEDVYAVGDLTNVPVPRAGVIAEGEAATVADVIVHKLRGGAAPPPFAGRIKCYLEMGDATIGKVDVDFLSGPAPVAVFTPPSTEAAAEKQEFGRTRRMRWFGHAG